MLARGKEAMRFILLGFFVLGGGITLTLLLFPQDAQAANRYWVGTAGGNTSDTANWASADPASCTGGGATVPGSADIAIFDADCDNSATIDAALNVIGINMNSGYIGTVTQASSSAVTVGASAYIQAGGTFSGDEAAIDINDAFTLSGGTFIASSSTTSVAGSFTISGTPTFTHNSGTVTFDGVISATLACNNVTFNLVTIDRGGPNADVAITVGSDCSLPLGANPTADFTDRGVSAGTILTLNGTLSGTGTLTMTGSGHSGQTISFGTTAVISGFSGISVADATIFSTSATTLNLGAYTTVNFDGAFTLSAGTFTAPSGTMTVATSFTISGGTFSGNGGTVTFDTTAAANIDCGTETLAGVIVNNASKTWTMTANCAVGAFTLTAGTVANPAAAKTLSVTGDFAENAATTFGGANLTVEFSGSPSQNISKTAGTFSSILTVNKTGSNAAKLTTALTDTGQTCTIVEGTFDLNGQAFTCSTGFTVQDGGTLELFGDESPTAPTLDSGSTVKYTGDGASDVDAYTIKDYTYHHLTIASVDSGDTFATPNSTEDANGNFTLSGGTFTAPTTFTIGGNWAKTGGTFTSGSNTVTFDGSGDQTLNSGGTDTGSDFNNLTVNKSAGTLSLLTNDIDIDGTLTITSGAYSPGSLATTAGVLTIDGGTFTGGSGTADINGAVTLSSGTLTAPTGTFTISGNWTNSGGTFTHNSGAVTFDGTSQTISGSTTFNNFTKTVTSADTLTFASSTTQTFAGTMTLKGAVNQLLSLRSDSDGTQWKIDPQGTRTIQYLDVKDSNNINSTAVDCIGLNCTDSGNNTNWTFVAAASTGTGGGTSGNAAAGTRWLQQQGFLPSPPSPEASEGEAAKPDFEEEEVGLQPAPTPPIIERIIPPIFRPPPPPPVEPEPVASEEVPQEPPLVFQGQWELLPQQPIREFVFAPLPGGITRLADKFPQLAQTLEEVGVSKITDLQRLQSARLTLPGLAQLSQLQSDIPTEVVFATLRQAEGKAIDFPAALTVTDQGEAQQRITTIVNYPLHLTLKPDQPAQSIKGYLVWRQKNPKPQTLHPKHELPLNSLLASAFFARPAFAQTYNPEDIETRLVLLEFPYTGPDQDGLWSADITAPAVDGEYEIINVIEYQDPELGTRAVRLIAVVDPEGYVYEQSGDKQIRIPGAIVSLHWLNSQASQYELWPAGEYQQENPQTTDVTGRYSFLVPEGTYYLAVEAPNYLSYQSDAFSIKEGSGVHTNIALKTKYWWLGIIGWERAVLILVVLLLLLNFWRDRIRSKIKNQNAK